jgi:hypothetical protein
VCIAQRGWVVYTAIEGYVIVYGGYGEAVKRVWRLMHLSGPLKTRRMDSSHYRQQGGIPGKSIGAVTIAYA